MAKNQNPIETRNRLLDAAFYEIFNYGYQGASLQAILDSANLSKGGMYNHFRSKRDLGLAVVEEKISPFITSFWLKPYKEINNPIDASIYLVEHISNSPSKHLCLNGCPLNNLIQEMSPIDEGFRVLLVSMVEKWVDGIAESFTKGIDDGFVREDVNPNEVASFLVASLEGAIGFAKCNQKIEFFQIIGNQLTNYLNTLRPVNRKKLTKTRIPKQKKAS